MLYRYGPGPRFESVRETDDRARGEIVDRLAACETALSCQATATAMARAGISPAYVVAAYACATSEAKAFAAYVRASQAPAPFQTPNHG